MANHYPNILKAAAEASLRSAIGSISGCHAGAVRVSVARGPAPGIAIVETTVKGWSPSLHRMTMQWRCTIPPGGDADMQRDALLAALEGRLAIQRRRAAEGLELGFARAPRVTEDDGRKVPGREDHVLVDRGLARLMEESEPGSFLRDVGDSLFQLHLPGEPVRDGAEERYDQEMLAEQGRESPGAHRLEGRALYRDLALSGGAVYDGRTLTLHQAVPDAVLSSAAGRRLGEVVDVSDAIAHHLVVGAEGFMVTLPTTLIEVEPDLATVADIASGPKGERT